MSIHHVCFNIMQNLTWSVNSIFYIHQKKYSILFIIENIWDICGFRVVKLPEVMVLERFNYQRWWMDLESSIPEKRWWVWRGSVTRGDGLSEVHLPEVMVLQRGYASIILVMLLKHNIFLIVFIVKTNGNSKNCTYTIKIHSWDIFHQYHSLKLNHRL